MTTAGEGRHSSRQRLWGWTRGMVLAGVALSLLACASGAPAPAAPPASSGGAATSAAASAPAAAAAAPAPTSTPTPERVVLHTPSESFAQLVNVVAIERGLFREQGLDVTMQQMPTNTALAAMLTGEVDYSETIGSVARAIVAQQAPLRVVAVAAEGIGFTLLGGPGVRTLADLKGKPIGFYAPRDTSVIGVMTVLRRQDIDPQRDEITVVPLGNDPALFAALATGAVSAVVTTPPYNFKAEKELGAYRLLDLSEHVASAWTGLSTSTRKLADAPGQVRAMIRANLRAVDYLQANRADVVRLAMARYAVDEDVAERAMEQYTRLLSRNGSAPPAALEGLVDMARQQSEVTEPVALGQVFDFGPLEQVQREPGGR